MAYKHGDLSEQMYHRIYRILQQEKDPHIIASALKLPVKTIQTVIDRINQDAKDQHAGAGHTIRRAHRGAGVPVPSWNSEPPMVFLSSKVRFAVVDIGGHLNAKNIGVVIQELREALSTDFKAFAVRLAEVKSVDGAVFETLLDEIGSFITHDRYVALLDPSPVVDATMMELKTQNSIPVFGTERAFEEAAFKVEIEFTKKKSKR